MAHAWHIWRKKPEPPAGIEPRPADYEFSTQPRPRSAGGLPTSLSGSSLAPIARRPSAQRKTALHQRGKIREEHFVEPVVQVTRSNENLEVLGRVAIPLHPRLV